MNKLLNKFEELVLKAENIEFKDEWKDEKEKVRKLKIDKVSSFKDQSERLFLLIPTPFGNLVFLQEYPHCCKIMGNFEASFGFGKIIDDIDMMFIEQLAENPKNTLNTKDMSDWDYTSLFFDHYQRKVIDWYPNDTWGAIDRLALLTGDLNKKVKNIHIKLV